MLDDLTKEIKAQLYERVKSPLFGAFALSWVGWNYRALLAVVSDMPFGNRMAYLDSLYPSTWQWCWHAIGGPLLTAIVFLMVYPWPARWMYSYWARQQKELKKVQQKIEDETPLTQDEANALRKVGMAQTKEFEEQISGLMATNKELNERLKLLQGDNIRLEGERKQFEETARRAEEQLTAARGTVLSPARQHMQNTASMEQLSKVLDKLSEEGKNEISSLFPVGHEVERDVFMYLVAAGGEGMRTNLIRFLGINPIDVQPAVQYLAGKGLLVNVNETVERLLLDRAGKEVARRTGLTSVLPRIN